MIEVKIHNGQGYREVFKDGFVICDDSSETVDRVTGYLSVPSNLYEKSVAWIGGGLCVGPKLFASYYCKQTIFEIEPEMEEFCPEGAKFVAGDWRETFHGSYDVIVYDLAGNVPEELSKHLNPGGVILP